MAIIRDDILEAVDATSVMGLNDLARTFEERFDVSAATMAVAGPAAAGGAAAAEGQTGFAMTLKSAGANRVGVIKAIREIADLGLEEAKDLVDDVPKPVKGGIDKKTADKLVKKLVGAGTEAEAK